MPQVRFSGYTSTEKVAYNFPQADFLDCKAGPQPHPWAASRNSNVEVRNKALLLQAERLEKDVTTWFNFAYSAVIVSFVGLEMALRRNLTFPVKRIKHTL